MWHFRENPIMKQPKISWCSNFLWNAGIFIWSSRTVLKVFQTLQPNMYALFSAGNTVYNTLDEDEFISKNYKKAENISVDYAIMEHSKNVCVIAATLDGMILNLGSRYSKLSNKSNEM